MVKRHKIATVIQARLTSSRLPGKILLDLHGKTVLERVVERVSLSSHCGEIWVATSDHESDDLVEIACHSLPVKVYRGSLHDVLGRFCGVIRQSQANFIIRVTADNPLTEPRFIDEGVMQALEHHYDYVCYRDMPYGSGAEIITSNALLTANERTADAYDREHVTPFVKRNSAQFNTTELTPPNTLLRPDIRVTLDTIEDYIKLFKIFHNFRDLSEADLTLEKVIDYIGTSSKSTCRPLRG